MSVTQVNSIDASSAVKHRNAAPILGARARVSIACAVAVAAAFAVSATQAAPSDPIKPPHVPKNLRVPPGFDVFLVGHAVGTQNYVCLPSDTTFKFTLFTPQATLFGEASEEIITHFFSPNPFENPPPEGQFAVGTVRATWQDANDSSTFWGSVDPSEISTDPRFVQPGAIAWLLARKAGVQAGPTGGAFLTQTRFVQRINTSGGLAPATGCASTSDVGHTAFVPYTADYVFYRQQ
jgi:hypothetical protein